MASDDVARVGDISIKIREAIRNALPTPLEQHLTIMVPGKVINLDDYTIGNSDSELLLSQKVELNNAILCDDMPPLANISMGPTGKSVSRSYVAAISKLVPSNTPIGIDDEAKLTEEHKRYKKAMQVLSSDVPDSDLTLIELYTEKQKAYTDAVEDKNKAFRAALEDSVLKGGRSKEKQRQEYDLWVSENAKTWRARVQAAYMDWVITGKKEEVEFWFAVVDQDSALARVERSKEVMRWAVVQDSDGSCEYNKVKLEPSDWANKCKDKMKIGTNQTKTVEWYEWEIDRLGKTRSFLALLMNDTSGEIKSKLIPRLEETANEGGETPEVKTEKALKAYLTAKTKFEETCSSRGNSEAKEDEIYMLKKKKELEEQRILQEKANVNKLIREAQAQNQNLLDNATGQGGFFDTQIKQIDEDITRYKGIITKLNGAKETATEDKFMAEIVKAAQIPSQTSPEPAVTQQGADSNTSTTSLADFFTPISVEVSSQESTERTSSSATSMSFGAQARYGLLSVSGSASHTKAHTEATKEMMSSNVKISFEVMRVDITRPWLRGEIFYDEELVAGPGVLLSPGFGPLKDLIGKGEASEKEKERYSSFPMYPVSFLVATNVVLEISGSTSSLHSYMNSSTTSAQASISYGPFGSAEGSYSASNSEKGASCKATASGCRIEMKAPQIIGWVSQLLPAIPRLNDSKELIASV